MKKSSEQKTQRTSFVVRIVFYAIGKADLLINLLLNKSRKLSELAKSALLLSLIHIYLATLMTVAGSTDYDIMAVQYTYAPVDPYPDVDWLLSGEGSWTGYTDDSVKEALGGTQQTSDIEEIKGLYSVVDKKVQEDVPMFSAYVISALGAVSNRLTGAEPSAYGFFNDVQNWDIAQ